MRLLTSCLNYIKTPTGRWTDVFDRTSIAQACGGYFAAAIGWVVFFNIGANLPLYSLLGKLLFVFLGEVTVGYFVASLAGIYLSFKKKEVPASQIFVLVGTAGFIKMLLVPWALLCAMFPHSQLGSCAALVLLFVFVLQIIYLVVGLKQLGPLTTADAIGAWIAGVLPWCMFLFVVGIFGIWGLALLL